MLNSTSTWFLKILKSIILTKIVKDSLRFCIFTPLIQQQLLALGFWAPLFASLLKLELYLVDERCFIFLYKSINK